LAKQQNPVQSVPSVARQGHPDQQQRQQQTTTTRISSLEYLQPTLTNLEIKSQRQKEEEEGRIF
jgi:hypothetical protein